MKRCLNCMNEYPDEYGDLCPSCGYMDGATLNGGVYLQPGSILQARYIVGTVIKERDTDIIYIGWDALFDRRVQIQEYFPRYCATRSGKPELSIYDNKQEMYHEGLELFYRQSRQLIRLYKEEDIITYHACFRENGTAYAIMDFSQDMTLKKRLENHLFRAAEAEDYLNQAMEAVMKVHQIDVFHGQIDPDCFWEKPGGSIVLKDFGASRYVSGEPGIVDYGSAGPHTDVYGLAKLFCQLITGKEIEDGEKLENELMRKQVSLKKPVVEALKRALLHRTRTIEAFEKEFWGRRKVPKSRKQKKNHGSLAVPRWVIIAAALLIAGLMVFTGLVASGKIDLRMQIGESRLERGQTRVPNVVNKSKKEAEHLLKKYKLKMDEGKMEYSEEINENMVSQQDIRENTVVDKNTTVTVNFSLGPEKGVFPQIVGVGREEALEMLKEARFTNIREEISQEEGVYDSVLSVSEEAGENVALSKEIVLTICKNETAQKGDATVQVNVPDVTGKSKAEAEAELTAAGFQVNWVEENSDQEEGSILAQKPAAGEAANEGSFVSVHISIGPKKLYMANLELETEEKAKEMITEMGLVVGKITQNYSDTAEKGKVISQSIARDTEVKPGDTVDLVISLGEKPDNAQESENKPSPTQAPKSTKAPTSVPAPALPPEQPQTTNEPVSLEESSPAQENNQSSEGVSGGSANGELNPTAAPTQAPTSAPTAAPTQAPTSAPTAAPTQAPTSAPTAAPTQAPTSAPTAAPTQAPTSAPTAAPTQAPTSAPTTAPTQPPAQTVAPTQAPMQAPASVPAPAPVPDPAQVPPLSPAAANENG